MSCSNSRSTSRSGGHVPAVFTCNAIRACDTWCCSRCTINDYIHRVKIHTDIQSNIEACQREMDLVIYIYQPEHKRVSSSLNNNAKYLLAHQYILQRTAQTQTTSNKINNSYKINIWVAVIVGALVEVEDTYLLYLPATQSEHVTLDAAPVAL